MSTITYIVKIASGKFTIDDAVAPKLTFRDGDTYIFDQSDGTNAGHILQFSATSNNSGSSEYTTGVTKTGTAGQAGAKTTIVTSSSTTDTLYYYSSGGGDHGREFSNSGFNTSANYNVLKPIVGSSSTAEKWGAMVNHAIDQIDLQAKDNRDYTDQHAFQGEPHIIPNTLYPAWSGLIDNHTGHTFTDSGNTGHTITPSGNTHHSGATEKIGSTSINFDGTGDYLSVADHADFDISGQFTIECWVNFRTKANYDGIITFDGTGGADFVLAFGSDNKLHLFSHAGNATSVVNSGDTINLNQWYHVAVSRDGSNNTNFYLDGVYKTTASFSANHTTTSGGVKVGRYYTADDEKYLDGYIDELRVSNTARYTGTSSFTPSTSAFSSDANTKLLIHSDAGGHVGAYGTAQADGKKYYYTDIKGSKPIKDPRIGAHFGSQRHKFTSVQLLEQETATHGKNVYSIDGREWARTFDLTQSIGASNDAGGSHVILNSHGGLEITGYFSAFNLIGLAWTGYDPVYIRLDGSTQSSTSLTFGTSTDSPLWGRYVPAGSVASGAFDSALTTPGIHTIRLWNGSESSATNSIGRFWGIELIAQDTTSTANKSKIQIPSQNVVSYGKKFTVSGTPHYDPFNGFTSGASVSSYVDTATSLGVEAWKNSSTYYRPYNGGRVVKWVDSSGTIKTSVNMMPPNAQNVAGSAISAKANASVANDTYLPTFSGAIDHSQSEVAKTFHWREFGNGSANGGPTGTYRDSSTLTTGTDDTAYVMDDGLTSMTTTDMYVDSNELRVRSGTDNGYYVTFIGTGLTVNTAGGILNIAQNLPYGTHIFWMEGNSSNDATSVRTLDGVSMGVTTWATSKLGLNSEFTFHQPKMPPVPDDACILMDVMLMADFVKQTDAEHTQISKGVRYCNGSRDHFYAGTNAPATNVSNHGNEGNFSGLTGGSSPSGSGGDGVWRLPFFGTTGLSLMENSAQAHSVKLGGSATTETALDNSVVANGDMMSIAETVTLGQTEIETSLVQGSHHFYGHFVATPIHTSSHYQTFETPFLHELVGGDRNMEQNNLVVTPDGKSWDEVTRDVSYIGNKCVSTTTDTGYASGASVIFDEWRGNDPPGNPTINLFNKDFAIAYDRLICLKDGTYTISAHTIEDTTSEVLDLKLNGTASANTVRRSYQAGTAFEGHSYSMTILLKRGDFLIQQGGWHGDPDYSWFEITKG